MQKEKEVWHDKIILLPDLNNMRTVLMVFLVAMVKSTRVPKYLKDLLIQSQFESSKSDKRD